MSAAYQVLKILYRYSGLSFDHASSDAWNGWRSRGRQKAYLSMTTAGVCEVMKTIE